MTVTVKGATELAAKTERMASKLEHPEGAGPKLADIFRQRIEQRFAASGEGDWAPLSAATVATKAHKGQDPAILRATGALHRALTQGRVDASGTQIRYAPATSLFYGAIVAARRPILPSGDPQLADKVTTALGEYVMEGT